MIYSLKRMFLLVAICCACCFPSVTSFSIRAKIPSFSSRRQHNVLNYQKPSPTSTSAGGSFQAFQKQNELRSFLLKYEPISNLGKVEQEVFLQLMQERQIQSGELLSQEGDPAKDFFVVKEGRLEAFRDDQILFTLDKGDLVGAISYAISQPYLYSVRSCTNETEVWQIQNRDIDKILSSSKRDFQTSMEALYKGDESRFKIFLETLEKEKILSQATIFQQLTPQERVAVASKLTLREYQKGESLIKQGSDKNTALYFLKDGELECYQTTNGGDKKSLKVYKKKGDLFGELGVFFNYPRQASIDVTSDKVHVWELSRSDLFEAVQESPLSSIAKLRLDEIYRSWVIQSRPIKKPVSFHSTFSSVASGVFLAALIPFFTPGKGSTLLFDLYTNIHPGHGKLVMLSSWMMTLTSVLGYLRLNPRAPPARKRLFEMAGAFNLYLTLVMSSNLNCHSSLWLFDGFSLPGKAALISSAILTFASCIRLIDDSIAGPSKGRETNAGMDTRLKGFLVSLVLFFLAFSVMAPVIPPLLFSSRAAVQKQAATFTALGINGWLISTCFTGIAQGSFGSALSTFQFEKKVTKKQGLFWACVLLLALNVDPVIFTVDTFTRLVGFPNAWYAQLMSKMKLTEIFVGSLVGTVLNAFRKRWSNKQSASPQ